MPLGLEVLSKSCRSLFVSRKSQWDQRLKTQEATEQSAPRNNNIGSWFPNGIVLGIRDLRIVNAAGAEPVIPGGISSV